MQTNVKCPCCTHETTAAQGWETFTCPNCKVTVPFTAASDYYALWQYGQFFIDQKAPQKTENIYRSIITQLSKSKNDAQLKKAMMFYVSSDYAYFLMKGQLYAQSANVLEAFDDVIYQGSLPKVSLKACEEACGTLCACYNGLMDQAKGTRASRRQVELKQMIAKSDPNAVSAVDRVELLIQGGANDADAGKFAQAIPQLRESLSVLKTAQLDADSKAIYQSLAQSTLARSLLGRYQAEGNKTYSYVEESLSLLESALPKLEELLRGGMNGVQSSYVQAELDYGVALLFSGHLLKGNKMVKKGKKDLAKLQKGKKIL